MNAFQLKNAFAPAQHDVHVCDITVSNLLHEIKSRRPRAKALVEVKNKGAQIVDGPATGAKTQRSTTKAWPTVLG